MYVCFFCVCDIRTVLQLNSQQKDEETDSNSESRAGTYSMTLVWYFANCTFFHLPSGGWRIQNLQIYKESPNPDSEKEFIHRILQTYDIERTQNVSERLYIEPRLKY